MLINFCKVMLRMKSLTFGSIGVGVKLVAALEQPDISGSLSRYLLVKFIP